TKYRFPRMRLNDDDLFKDTTMSFGEHLEELRTHLVKAMYGLVLGVAIGLLIATPVLKFVQTPVQEALSKYWGSLEAADCPAGYVRTSYHMDPAVLKAAIAGEPMPVYT